MRPPAGVWILHHSLAAVACGPRPAVTESDLLRGDFNVAGICVSARACVKESVGGGARSGSVTSGDQMNLTAAAARRCAAGLRQPGGDDARGRSKAALARRGEGGSMARQRVPERDRLHEVKATPSRGVWTRLLAASSP